MEIISSRYKQYKFKASIKLNEEIPEAFPLKFRKNRIIYYYLYYLTEYRHICQRVHKI